MFFFVVDIYLTVLVHGRFSLLQSIVFSLEISFVIIARFGVDGVRVFLNSGILQNKSMFRTVKMLYILIVVLSGLVACSWVTY
jgi:hypothetical protein